MSFAPQPLSVDYHPAPTCASGAQNKSLLRKQMESRMVHRIWKAGCLSLATTLVVVPAGAGPQDNSLSWASDSMPSNIDFYQHTIREGIVLAQHIWDTLLYRSSKSGEIEPHLAESFRYLDDTTIEFRLRQGVHFHDGSALTADDVVATVNYINSNTTALPLKFLAGAEKVDDYTVRVHTIGIFPPVLEFVASMLPIYPANYYAEVGPEGMSRAPIGTGPYRVIEHVAGERITMESFDDYFGGVKGKPSIDRIEFRRIGEFNTQAIELMSGGIDWIWRVPPDAMNRLQTVKSLATGTAETMRVAYIPMDAIGRAGESPLKDLRVRKAINHAIDREGIRAALMGDGATLIETPCAPQQVGCVTDQITPYAYDPQLSRELLAEAGYPNGFDIEFWGYRDKPIIEAVFGNLAEVGINARLTFVQASAIAQAREEGRTPFWFQAWGGWAIQDASASIGQNFAGGANDYARDPKIIELLEATRTNDAQVRLDRFAEINAIMSEKAYTVPMFTYALNYAHNSQLEFTLTPDETPRFFEARWKQ